MTDPDTIPMGKLEKRESDKYTTRKGQPETGKKEQATASPKKTNHKKTKRPRWSLLS